MIRYCPTCNRSTEQVRFIGEFCENCVARKIEADLGSSVTVVYCKRCMRIKTNEGYQKEEKESLASVISKELCNSKCKVKVKRFDSESAFVELTFHVGDDSVTVEREIGLKMKHMICQDDYRKSSGYYEAVVQLRGSKERVERMAEKIQKFIAIRNAFIAKFEEIDKGIDLYVSDKKTMKWFFLMYKLAPKTSYTLYSVRQGKKIYRDTYLLKLE